MQSHSPHRRAGVQHREGTWRSALPYAVPWRRHGSCLLSFRLYEGLVERAARPGYAGPGAAETAEDGDKAFVSGADRSPSPRPSTGEQQVRKECGFSQVLVDNLKAHRLQITKAHLADDFGVAFDLALYALCVDLRDRGYRARPLDLRAVETRPSSSLNDLAGTPADRVLEAREKTLELDWLSLPPAEGFAALAALPSEAKQKTKSGGGSATGASGEREAFARPPRRPPMPHPVPAHKSFADRSGPYQEITDKIIAELEQGRLPWVRFASPFARRVKPYLSGEMRTRLQDSWHRTYKMDI